MNNNTNFIFLNISPNDGCGFCNQLYSIVNSCYFGFNNNIKIVFIDKYLMEINTNNKCNISEIIDLKATNIFLKKYNIILIDLSDIDFKIVNIKYGLNNFSIDITSEILKHNLNNLSLFINKNLNLDNIKGKPLEYYKNKFGIPFNQTQNQNQKLYITYSINDSIFEENYSVSNGFLINEFSIDLINYTKITFPTINDGSTIFKDILRNIVFNNIYVSKANDFIKTLKLSDNQKINSIHLRLEDDAIQSWSKTQNMELDSYKKILEEKYIEKIQQFIDKNILTIILSHNYDNNVIKFLKENNYNYIITPNLHKDRDVSAIIDLHIGQFCNNKCICVFESTFSFTLVSRIYNYSNVQDYLIFFRDINNNNTDFYFK